MRRYQNHLWEADILSYWWKPLVFWEWTYSYPGGRWMHKRRGAYVRIGPIGIAFKWHRAGVYHNGSHWMIIFHYRREYEEMF